ncbi:hypothetical protein GQ55_6G053900 [Panicum hallii var. hallii]|uniref:BHLH domain-containing protein n=1 Tax=Panicum hallii var. hallii TaxID=1504633 RepID=A0A2T7D457_9POAL|nr:hypothetical protein GQ55_6G053900 [Panicum hallii var. hallii]
MADHQEMIHPAAAAAAGGASHGGDWWSTAVSCSPDQLPGFGGGLSPAGAADGSNRSRSGNAASSESPGSNSLATGGSSITFQEPAGVADPGAVVVPQTATGLAAAWNQPYYLDGSGFHGYMSSSRGDQVHLGLRSPSSNNNSLMLQDPHDPNHQFLSNLGLELLSSPTSPSGGFRSSSLLRSLTEPSAAATKPSLGFQQYQQQTMNQAPSSIREALQFTNSTPFWNPSSGFAAAAAVEGAASLGTAAGPPSGQSKSRPASLAAKSALEGAGDSSSIITKKANADPTPLKKARTGTPSPLPTFKVRKEKLGDRITALQQLVSPFGKTDTASVLHETIEYIKFLHQQVGSLSAPYLKNRQQVPHLKVSRDGGEAAAAKGDLTGRGLCLVPISSTFAVASETPVDFWSPFGAAFR